MANLKRKGRFRYEKTLKRKRKEAKRRKARGNWHRQAPGMRNINEKLPLLLKNLDKHCDALEVFRKIDEILGRNGLSGTLHDVSLTKRGFSAVLKVTKPGYDFLIELHRLKLRSRMAYFSKASFHEKRNFRKYSELKPLTPRTVQLCNLGPVLDQVHVQCEWKKSASVLLVPQDKVFCIFIAKSLLLEIDFNTLYYDSFHFIEKSSKDFAFCLTIRQPPRVFKKDQNGSKTKCYYFSRNLEDKEDAYGARRVEVGDFTKTGVLGRCFRYRFCFKTAAEMQEMVSQFASFHLINPKKFVMKGVEVVKTLSSRQDVGSWTGSAVLDQRFTALPFALCYALQVLVASKACLVTGQNGQIVLEAITTALDNGVAPEVVQLLLEEMEKGSSSKFMRLFPSKLREKLAKIRITRLVTREIDDITVDKNVFRIRRVIITPLRVVPQAIDLERGNRVLRNISSEKPERFVRANVASEDFSRINGLGGQSYDECKIAQRIERCLREGVVVGGRRFKFLAHSNSQLKSHSCWLYDEKPANEEQNCDSIEQLRGKIGLVSHIKFVGKRAARVGQAFSTTTQSLKLKPSDFGVIEDIERNGKVFSDGVGLISTTTAKQVAESLDLDFIPAAFQVRLGGFKGMLCRWPDEHPLLADKKVQFRNSMKKFDATHRTLEICRFATSHAFNLNKQLISLLSALGVSDQVFWDLYSVQRSEVEQALKGDKSCMKEVLSSLYNDGIDKGYSMMSVALLMLSAGMNPLDDPFFEQLLRTVCHRQMYLLRSKLRIKVNEGVCLLGVLDEYGVLEEGEVFCSFGSRTVDKTSPLSNRTVLECDVVVGRNPSLHCGDLRALKAVNRPEFDHLVDIIVFSQKGERPLPDMMSGGDLDGDEYFISWNKHFNRAVKHSAFPPMGAVEANDAMSVEEETNAPVFSEDDDAIDFFVKFILCDNLGVIANAFLVWADKSPEGAKCAECLEIAELHSKAVDFAKNGQRANLSRALKPKEYPDFMGKEPNVSYPSTNVMGDIYRDVREHHLLLEPVEEDLNDFISNDSQSQSSVDSEFRFNEEDLVGSFQEDDFYSEGFKLYEDVAQDRADKYNKRLMTLMENYGVLNEAEVLSGFCVEFESKGKNAGEKKFQIQERLNDAVTELLKETRKEFWSECGLECYEEFDVSVEESKREKARQLASAMYYVTYFLYETSEDTLFSFPWVVARVLFEIRDRKLDVIDLTT